MKRRVTRAHGTALSITLLLAAQAAAQFDPPEGIYVLGRGTDISGTPDDDRLDNIRDYDFVSGFTLRVRWTDIEPTQGAYDFAVIDQAIQQVAPLGQKINLEVLNLVPDYVLNGAAATYTDHRGGTRPVPWDAFGRTRQAALIDALASHVVADGLGLALNEHPVISAVSSDPMGLNFGVRDLNDGIQTHPDYTRQKYVDAVVEGVAYARAAFPLHEGYLSFFSYNDQEPGPRVDEVLIETLDAQYNGPGQPALSFFIENLSDAFPAPDGGGPDTGNNLLEWTNRGGRTMMQALDSWLSHDASRDPQLASLNPATGVEHAFENFGTRFFELYIIDLDGAADGAVDAEGRPLLPDLRAWNDILTSDLLPGDTNGDGVVDLLDLDTIGLNFGDTTATLVEGDINNDESVDLLDLDILGMNFGETLPTMSAPEPGAALTGLMALVALRLLRLGPRRAPPRVR